MPERLRARALCAQPPCSHAPPCPLRRMVEPESGSILIDGVDIASLGLARLRGCLAIIPQESLMFSGSVRHNLAPLGEAAADDESMWQVGAWGGCGPPPGKLPRSAAAGGRRATCACQQMAGCLREQRARPCIACNQPVWARAVSIGCRQLGSRS